MLSDSSMTFASWLNLLVLCSRAPEMDATFALVEQNIATLIRRHPRGVALLMVVLHHERAPDEYAQRAIAILKRFRPQILGAATVLEASGFAAAAQRALGTSIIGLTGMGRVLGVFNRLEAGTEFVASHMFTPEQRIPHQQTMLTAVKRYRDQMHAEMVAVRSVAGTP
jgi:hypothetical protein